MMVAIGDYVLIELLNGLEPVAYRMCPSTSLYKKDTRGTRKIQCEEDIDGPVFIVYGTVEVEVKVIDNDDDIKKLRERNEHLSNQRIPILKRQSINTPKKKPATKNKSNRPKKGTEKKQPLNKGNRSDRYFLQLSDRDEDDETQNPLLYYSDDEVAVDTDILGDNDNNGSHNHGRPTASDPGIPEAPSPKRSRTSTDADIMQSIRNLAKQTAANSRQIDTIRKETVTKRVLDETLAKYMNRTTENRENHSLNNEPEMNEEHKVQVLDDFAMDYNLYYSAIKASTNSFRAKKVMAEYWPGNTPLHLLTEYDPKKPDMTIVEKGDYHKLINIMDKLESIQSIPVYTKKDRVMANMKKWVSKWIKSKKSTHKKRTGAHRVPLDIPLP